MRARYYDPKLGRFVSEDPLGLDGGINQYNYAEGDPINRVDPSGTNDVVVAGIEGSVGSRGDAYDNALAESVIGLFKTEVIRHAGPWRSLDDVEYATLEWVAWFNTCRLLEPLGYLPPAEYELQFERLTAAPPLLEHSTT